MFDNDNSNPCSPLRVAFHTFGCRSNYADTIDIQSAVFKRSAVPCSFDSVADVYVINTCTVTDEADRTALRMIRKLRKRTPEARIIVTGCLAEVSGLKLCKPGFADVAIGTGRNREVLGAIFNEIVDFTKGSNKALPLSTEGPGTAVGENTMRARYHLRIQDGCENHCTFCIIPRSRGLNRSLPISKVISDIKSLYSSGYREVVLSGTNLGSFGEDASSSFYELLYELGSESSIPRIRLSSLDPEDLSAEIIDLIAESNVFCKHLHICIQALSDSVLKRMNRRYSLSDACWIVNYVRERIARGCIGADVIVGFPGESREDFDDGVAVLESLPLSYLHVFPYSERDETPALRLGGPVSMEERRRRSKALRSIAQGKKIEFMQNLIGFDVEMIIERIEDDHIYGTSGEYASVKYELPDNLDTSALAVGSVLKLQAASYDESEEKLICA